MSDNVQTPVPAGTSFGTKDVGGVHHHKILITDASGNVIGVSSASPVVVGDGGGSLTVDGSVSADTELPAAAALGDSVANPTTPMVGAGAMVWDSTTSQFKRARTAGKDAEVAAHAQLVVPGLYNGSTVDRARSDTGDGQAATGIQAVSANLYNGATFDRPRNNQAVQTLLAPADRTTSPSSVAVTNYNARGLILLVQTQPRLDQTTFPNAPTGNLYPIIYAYPEVGVTNPYSAVLSGFDAMIAASGTDLGSEAGTHAYILYPGASTLPTNNTPARATKKAVAGPLPRRYLVQMVLSTQPADSAWNFAVYAFHIV